jgi:heme A synthase
MRTIRTFAWLTTLTAYALILLGAVVRITGSGMGCGDHWPLCNGHLIPPLDDPATLIEWGHRLVAGLLSFMIVGLAALAWLRRAEPGSAGRGGTLRPALLAVGLLVIQVLLGAVTVWLELPPGVVILHLGTALALLAVLQVVAMRTGDRGQVSGVSDAGVRSHVSGVGDERVHAGAEGRSLTPDTWHLVGRGAAWALWGAAGLGAATLLLGGLTANLGAAPACLGFPLCSGQIWPQSGGSGLAHVHWAHRLLAYALLFHLVALVIALRARAAPARLQGAVWAALAVAALQVALGAAMVLEFFPPALRAGHAAVGAGLWMVLVWGVWEGSRKTGLPSGRP